MKTLQNNTDIEGYVSQLRGYLAAVSHLNDQPGFRHRFSADMIWLEHKKALSAIYEYIVATTANAMLPITTESLELIELDLRKEQEIIEKYISSNLLLGEATNKFKNIGLIKEQLRWHIQDYTKIAAVGMGMHGKWACTSKNHKIEWSQIFTQIDSNIVVASFLIEREEIGT